MTINYVENGDIFQDSSKSIVIPVNLVGIWGAGLALEAKKLYHGISDAHYSFCHFLPSFCGVQTVNDFADRKTMIKHDLVWQYKSRNRPDQIIIAYPTKWSFRDQTSDLQLIENQMTYLKWRCDTLVGNGGLAMPALGCGFGNLKWKDVKPIIDGHFADTKYKVAVYMPHNQFAYR